MRELQDIVRGWTELRQRGQPVLLATVVATSGSTYRRPGARLLLSAERWIAGGISGGCLERDVLQKAWWRTREGPVVVSYDSTSADDEETWTFGLGCNGRVDVLLERLPEGGETHPIEFIAECLAARRTGVMATVFRDEGRTRVGQRLLRDTRGSRSDLAAGPVRDRVLAAAESTLGEGRTRVGRIETEDEAMEVLLEVIRPPRSLVVFGTGQDAVPLVQQAVALGFHVTVVSNTSGGVPAELFRDADVQLTASPAAIAGKLVLESDSAIVVMTHNLGHDRGYLRFALESGCSYVGVLGPRARTERLLDELREGGFPFTERHRASLYSPVGLNLGAEQPEEIALSILSEIQARFSGADAQSLRLRPGPIHGRSA
ncbi:MAG TPA: XdhC family protein [Myxococcaceae bacterium]|nr:XdhC family protein [Myxococcaceae bacterium]